jgi:formate--tetrahydrofolate ligase
MRSLRDVAEELGLEQEHVEVRGAHAKVGLAALEHTSTRRGRYVLVTAMTPNKSGIGKSVTAIGLAMGLRRLGTRAAVTLRQSSLGPILGLKGGGAGGGAAALVPLDHCLLGLGSDLFAVESANNLLAAVVEDALFRGKDVDPASVSWRRVMDMDDRALREVQLGSGRSTGFDITAASEVMALLALSRDLPDLRARLDRVVPCWDTSGRPVTAGDLQAAGAMAVLLRDAAQPNLLQTSDGTPALVHTGPFGNIAAGCSSVIADLVALPRVDYVVTEAGFGSDLGAEKLVHLKAPLVGTAPDAAVLVATVAALREHGGSTHGPDPAAVEKGCANLLRHVEVLRGWGIPVVVDLNRFPDDSAEEVSRVLEAVKAAGCAAVTSEPYTRGAEGCLDLAVAVALACETPSAFVPSYRPEEPLDAKVEALATKVYGADEVVWSDVARERIAALTEAGYGGLPVCMAKTHLSLSADPKAVGAPVGFDLPVRDVRLAAGAGYVTVYAGAIATMPGLPSRAHFQDMDLDADGAVVGLV